MILIYRKNDGKILTIVNAQQSIELLLQNYEENSVDILDIEFNGTPADLRKLKVDLDTMQLVSRYL